MKTHPRKPAYRRTLLATSIALLSPLCLGIAPPAWAQSESASEVRSYRIPAGSLGQALNEFAQQAGIAISFDANLVKGLTSPGLQGSLGIEDGIKRLLAGSGLQAVRSTSGYRLEATPKSSGPVILPPLRVLGTEPARYEITGTSSVTGVDTPLIDTPRSVQVVPEQVILDQSSQDLRDALKNVSGVQLLNETGGRTDAYYIRGHRSVNVFQDGAIISRNASRLQTSNIERVEVIKGPAAFSYGSTDVGGVVNVVTKRPLEEARNTITTTVDQHGRRDLLLDSTGRVNEDGSLLYRFVGSLERSETFRSTTRPDEINRDLLAPSLTWKIDDQSTLTAALEITSDELPGANSVVIFQDNNGDLSVFNQNLDRAYNEPGDGRNTSRKKFSSYYQHMFNNGWTLDGHFSYENNKSDSVGNNLVRGLSAALGPTDTASVAIALTTPFAMDGPNLMPSGLLVRQLISGDNDNDIYHTKWQLNGEFETGSVIHNMVIGGDYRKSDFEFSRSLAVINANESGIAAINPLFADMTTLAFTIIDAFNPVYGASEGELALFSEGDNSNSQLGLYVQDQITISEQFQIALGLRFDDFKRDSRTHTIRQLNALQAVVDANSITETNTPAQTELSPSTSFIYKPAENLTLYATYSESFQPNGLFTNLITGATRSLDPTEGEQFELGFKSQLLDDKLFINAAIFDTTRTNILVDRIAVGLPNEGDPVIADGVNTKGLEFDATVQFSEGLSLIFNYAYQDSKDKESGNRPINVAKNTANMWATYEFTEGDLQGLGFGGGINYAGKRYNNFSNTFELDAFTTYEVTAFYYIPTSDNSQLRIQAGVKNLTDEEYFFSGGDLGLGVGDPRTAYASIGWEF